jgi:adenine-specific DNA-methyltransferase
VALETPDPVTASAKFPAIRYMGSKARLLPWLHEVFDQLEFGNALDAFSGSGCVSYLLKAMGKEVIANDFLLFPTVIAKAVIENSNARLSERDIRGLLAPTDGKARFIEKTYSGLFFTPQDLAFLDNTWARLRRMRSPQKRALALTALIRSCAKRQPRGVFTVADPERYHDGRRDLRLSLREHFVEQVAAYNAVVFDSGASCTALRGDVLDLDGRGVDLVYMDPPYVPRSDDNCYVKRYHFLEGLASYWEEPGAQPDYSTRTRKIPKRYSPFSYRKHAIDAFDRMFKRFSTSTLVLSYSSNGYPDLDVLTDLLGRYKTDVVVYERQHRYHFGTHANVREERAAVREYLLVGVG